MTQHSLVSSEEYPVQGGCTEASVVQMVWSGFALGRGEFLRLVWVSRAGI